MNNLISFFAYLNKGGDKIIILNKKSSITHVRERYNGMFLINEYIAF